MQKSIPETTELINRDKILDNIEMPIKVIMRTSLVILIRPCFPQLFKFPGPIFSERLYLDNIKASKMSANLLESVRLLWLAPIRSFS